LSTWGLLKRPTTPMAKIFNKIDRSMKVFFDGKSPKIISEDLPDGEIFIRESFITSNEMIFENHNLSVYFSGRIDAFINFNDNSFGIVDFKTSDVTPHHEEFYGRQLQAYVYSLENPNAKSPLMNPVSHIGLLYFSPNEMSVSAKSLIALNGLMVWKETKRNDAGFRQFIDEVLTVLELPEPPEPNPECLFANTGRISRMSGF